VRRFSRLRLWGLALVVGAAAQTSSLGAGATPPPSSCAADLVAPLRDTGRPTPDATFTCRPASDAGVLVEVRTRRPRAGAPCEDLQYHRVEFVAVGGGAEVARFALFGGLSQGTLALRADQVAMISSRDAYVADVQLGTYEPRSDGGGLRCRLDPRYHFDCPTTRTLDQLCLVWTPKRSADERRRVVSPRVVRVEATGPDLVERRREHHSLTVCSSGCPPSLMRVSAPSLSTGWPCVRSVRR